MSIVRQSIVARELDAWPFHLALRPPEVDICAKWAHPSALGIQAAQAQSRVGWSGGPKNQARRPVVVTIGPQSQARNAGTAKWKSQNSNMYESALGTGVAGQPGTQECLVGPCRVVRGAGAGQPGPCSGFLLGTEVHLKGFNLHGLSCRG
eukprot:1943845-Amphidinium_carterae.1